MRLTLLFAAILLFGTVFPTPATGELHARPNILWLVSEDNNPFLGAYGDALANTPTLDKLAKEGVVFERCFAQPVCAPSRFALITGMHSVSCGPAEHMRAQGKIPAWLQGFPSHLRTAGYFVTNNAKTDYNSPIDSSLTWNESSKNAHYLHRPDPKQPFFAVFNDETTHESCLFPADSPVHGFEPMSPQKIRIPPYQPDTPEIRADWARYYDRMRLMDAHVAEKLEQLEKNGLAADTIIFYYGDNGGVLPRSKRSLQQSGTHVPLIVYFPPKWRHLAPAAPGSRISDPVSFVDFGATALSLAGVKIPDYIQGRAFAGMAKGEPNEFVYCTRDRMDERYDMIRSVMDKRWLYIRNYRPDLPYVQPLAYMFRARGYQSWARIAREGKLTPATAMFWGEKPAEELYDMSTDPDNVRNLAAVESSRPTLERMRAALTNHTLAVFDNGFIPEGSDLEGYEASRRPGAYPLQQVVELANLASERNPSHLPRFIAALEDANEAMRWWAAQGCAMLRDKAAPAEAALLKHLEDSSWPVRLSSADALARLGRMDDALPVFKEGLAQKGGAVRLQTANILTQLGEAARPVLPAMKAAVVADESGRETEGTKAEQYTKRYPRDLLAHTIDELEGRIQRLSYPGRPDQN